MKTQGIALAWLCLLSGCGGSDGDSGSAPPVNNPPPVTPKIEFRNLAGTAPADAALGQPLTVEWMLPAGIVSQSVALEASLLAGPVGSQTSCDVSAGPLAGDATSATITIPNTCGSKTVKDVRLQVTVDTSTGGRITGAHAFTTPALPATFLPQRLNLPVLRITTDNLAPIMNRDDYVSAQMLLESEVLGAPAVVGGLQIRGRGNSTWGMPKKPYRIKLTDKRSLLGMPSSRDWVLLANYSDKTLLRNTMAMELGERIGMAWTPRSAFVEVYLNDRYDGVYLLSENIKVAKDRVDIDELAETDNSADLITGGYLLEVDFRRDGHTIVSALDQLPIVFQDPEEPSPEQETYIKGYVDELESVLRSPGFADPDTGYAALIDVDSFVRWFLVNELFRNRDANMWTSCWMYKPRGGKLHMGPLWDFDIAAGNIDYDAAFQTEGWWVRDAAWFSRLFEDPAFVARVKLAWNELKSDQLPALMQSISSRSVALQQAQLNNFQRWPILESYVWPNYRIPGSYAGEIDYLATWLTARAAWMDARFNP